MGAIFLLRNRLTQSQCLHQVVMVMRSSGAVLTLNDKKRQRQKLINVGPNYARMSYNGQSVIFHRQQAF